MPLIVRGEDRYISPWNAAPEVRSQMHLPARVILNDITLREGRQVNGLHMTTATVQRVARQLEQAGLPMIQLRHIREEIEAVGRLGLSIRTEVLLSSPTQTPPFTVQAQKERIDFILGNGLGLDLCFGTSDQVLEARRDLRGDRQDLPSLREREMEAALECVAYAKGRGGSTGTNLQDFLRADFDFVARFCRELARVGVDLISLDDFAAPAIPTVYKHVFHLLKEEVPQTPLGIHVTNDFGLGTALVLGALEGGAEVLDVGVNSYGARTGHADLAEVAVAVELFYGMETGVDLANLMPLSQRVAEELNLPIPANKPLVGTGAFCDASDVHFLYHGHPWVYRALRADVVGNRDRVGLASVSGPTVIEAKARELGVEMSAEQCRRLVPRVHALLAEKRRELTDDEFRELVEGSAGRG